jgi:hypothetical protein
MGILNSNGPYLGHRLSRGTSDVLDRGAISRASTRPEAIHGHFSGAAVAANQAVFASGLDPVTGGEPEPPRPLMETGSLGGRAPQFEIVARKPIAIQQLAS